MSTRPNLPARQINRTAFFKLLAERVSTAEKHGTKIALLIVDIDRFHRINNIYGYHIGDQILLKLIELLNSVRRQQDYLYRIGDNRFALILRDIMNTGHAQLAAQKIQRLLEPPFHSNNNKIPVECTIGITVFPIHARTVEALVRECEEVLHNTRLSGQRTGVSVERKEEDELSELWDLEMALGRALDKQQLHVYYQPQISIDSGAPVGAEALIRWIHPNKGLIQPGLFIPIAEKTGLIKPITNWLLNTVLRHSSKWTKKWGPLSASVNIPPDFILRPYLKDFIVSALHLWSSDNITLILEIIERSLMEKPELCFKVLEELHSMGIRISIDDFGTGYSTLSYFKFIPVDELKIDQSFVANLVNDKADQNIVRLITDLAHSFEMNVVAEGVGNSTTLNIIKKFGVDIGQGYHIARPMPADEFRTWLMEFNPIR